MNWPKISWYCATWRRPALLNELVECFLRQDYAGEKELIILNDEPDQRLVFNHPEVKVFNWPHRIASLSGKLCIAASECTGEVLFPADDDDIYLPHRSTVSVKGMAGGIFKPSVFLIDTDPIQAVAGRLHTSYAFTPKRLMAAGMYPQIFGFRYRAGDMYMCRNMDLYHRGKGHRCKRLKQPYYLYRKFTTNVAHVSTGKADSADPDFSRGNVNIEPGWTRDWQAVCGAVDITNPVPVFEVDSATYKADEKMNEMHDLYLAGIADA